MIAHSRASPRTKLHFEPNPDYQHRAIEAVRDLFRGQETCRTELTVTREALEGLHALARP